MEYMYKLPTSCSVFTAESYSIIKALELITDHHLQDTIIFTDSVNAINNIKNTYNPSDIALYIQNNSIIIENERADLAAKTAISSSLSTSTYIISYRNM